MKRVLGPHGIPYRFAFLGHSIRVRWGDPSGENLRRKTTDYGYYCEAEKKIYLATFLRQKKHRREAWRTFVHELRHAINHLMRGITVTDEEGFKWKWKPLSHRRIYLDETPLAMLMLENPGVFSPCPPPSARSSSGSRRSSRAASSS